MEANLLWIVREGSLWECENFRRGQIELRGGMELRDTGIHMGGGQVDQVVKREY